MKISVNGQRREIGVTVLSAALAELGYEDAAVATAVNGRFVAAHERGVTLSEGDKIEIVAPMQGG